MQKRVLIVEDHEEIQILYKAMFRRQKDIVIVAQEYSINGVLEKIEEEKPDLIMIDITLDGVSGLEFTRNVKQRFPQIKVLIVTGHDPERYMKEAMDAGADKLTTKNDAAEIVQEVRRLLFG